MKAKPWISNNLRKIMIPEAKKAGILLLFFLPLAIFPLSIPAAEGKEAEVLLLHTNNVTGYLFPCPT